MRNFLTSIFAVLVVFATTNADVFEANIEMPTDNPWTTRQVIMPPSPIQYQVLFVGQHDEVQTVDENGNPNGTQLAKQWHDFIGFTPDNESEDLGWVSVNHEMILADDKIGDGGGMTVFKVRRNANTDMLEIVDQNLPDGRSGKFFNVDFKNITGETGMNCGGITSNADGRIWTAEEWWQGSNEAIYLNGGGFRDTTDWTINTDIPGNFDGTTIKRHQNVNYMVEIDPKTAKAVRKQYNWGRQPFEGGCILPDNKTAYLGADATPGFFTKFVADVPGDFTRGTTYVYKQDAGSYTGSWVEIDNSDIDKMLNFADEAVKVGATMFNRIEWVAYNETDGKVYFTETGRDNPGGRWADEAAEGGTFAQHNLDRAAEQGVDITGDEYWDYYGRVVVFDPADNSIRSYIEGGPYWTGENGQPYPNTHLTNPDGLNFMYTGGKTYMIINEDLNGTSMGRVPLGVSNRTCELYMLDMEAEPTYDNLIRIAVVPLGAEVTGACPTPDGKSLLVNSQHPSSDNPFPYNNSLTFELTGWDKVATSIQIEDDSNDEDGAFKIWPNPVSRELRLNQITDVAIYDATGTRVKVYRNTDVVDVSSLTPGAYFVKNLEGDVQKLIVQ